jgi:hypothetical protein
MGLDDGVEGVVKARAHNQSMTGLVGKVKTGAEDDHAGEVVGDAHLHEELVGDAQTFEFHAERGDGLEVNVERA